MALDEETGLAVDPDDLVYVCDEAGEPAPEQYMVGIDYAVHRDDISVPECEASEHVPKHTHVDRFGEERLAWLLDAAKEAIQ